MLVIHSFSIGTHSVRAVSKRCINGYQMTTSGRHEGETWPDEVQAAEGIVEMEKEKAVKKDRLLCGYHRVSVRSED
jgi:hypothetical protein